MTSPLYASLSTRGRVVVNNTILHQRHVDATPEIADGGLPHAIGISASPAYIGSATCCRLVQ